MSLSVVSVDTIEKERRAVLEQAVKMFAADVDELKEMATPGGFMCHEVFHTLYISADLFAHQVTNHPAVVTNPEWFRKAQTILGLMVELQNDISSEHIGEEE